MRRTMPCRATKPSAGICPCDRPGIHRSGTRSIHACKNKQTNERTHFTTQPTIASDVTTVLLCVVVPHVITSCLVRVFLPSVCVCAKIDTALVTNTKGILLQELLLMLMLMFVVDVVVADGPSDAATATRDNSHSHEMLWAYFDRVAIPGRLYFGLLSQRRHHPWKHRQDHGLPLPGSH
mmetsp:Transcript_29585/g.61654  ORF Transcript_29585/g.61654 Transcript_29585/m.61654 type:complete len:179 (-) Transcript_29585:41-577(-)